MLIPDYVRSSENKIWNSRIHRQKKTRIQDMLTQESKQPSLEILAESLKLQCSETGIILAIKDFFSTTPNLAGCEDDLARYVTLLKITIRKYSPQILHQLFDSERKRFPVFEQLLKYSFHDDVMIKNAARLSLLFILKECQDEVKDYIIQYGAPQYAINMSVNLKLTTLNLQDSVKKGKENSIISAIYQFEEDMEYIDDLLSLKHEVVIDRFRTTFIQKFVVPILTSIAEQNGNSDRSVISFEINLFLVQKLLQIATNRKFKNEIIELLMPIKLQKSKVHYYYTIFNTTSIKNITKLKNMLVQNMKKIVSDVKPNFSQFCALRILYIAVEFFLHCNDNYGVFIVYKTFIEVLMKHFLPETIISMIQIKRLDLIYAVLELIARREEKYDTFWSKINANFEKILQAQYLELCKHMKFDNILESTDIIDKQYDVFLDHKSNFLSSLDDIVNVIPNKNNVEYLEYVDFEEVDIHLRKLFYIRNLCLHLHKKIEKILPLLNKKIQTGVILSTGNNIPCKILDQNTYTSKGFFKLTSCQILILQGNESNKGTVVFSCYYKDLSWRKNNETLLLKENGLVNVKTVSIIQLKFNPVSRICIISKTLAMAKQKQKEILNRKLNDLLEIVHSQNEGKSNMQN